MNGPIRWFGGKGKMTAKLLSILEQYPHHTYVEVFGGGASLLFAKPPRWSKVEVYNDIDQGLYEFFLTLAKPEEFDRFYRRVALLPYSRQLFEECRATWQEQDNRHERVWRWFVVARQSFGGRFGAGWGLDVTASSRGMALTTLGWLSCLERLPEIHARLQRVQIECSDWRTILEIYDTPETLFYCDPPYVPSTRKDGRYKHELTEADHADLVDALLRIRGKAMVSGYEHRVYERLTEAGWRKWTFDTACHAVGRTKNSGLQGKGTVLAKQPRREVVWASPVPGLV